MQLETDSWRRLIKGNIKNEEKNEEKKKGKRKPVSGTGGKNMN